MTAPERIYMKPNDMYENGWARPIDTDQFDEEATEYIRADLAAVHPAQVRVKPLVWDEFGKECVRAESPFGLYDVMWGFGVELAYFTHCGKMWKHPTIAAAKAAAQADYEARILAALEPQPDLRDEVIKGLMEAAQDMRRAFIPFSDDEFRAVYAVDAALAAAKAVQHG